MDLLIIAAAAAFSVLAFFGSLAMPSRASVIRARLHTHGDRPLSLQEVEWQQPFSRRILLPVLSGVGSILGRLTPQGFLASIRKDLDLAGNPFGWRAADFLALRAGAGLLGATGAVLVGLASGWPQLQLVGGAIILGVLGFLLPIVWLSHKIAKRSEEMLLSFPDALDLLTISVEAGMGFDGAIAIVADKWRNELGRAFERVLTEMRLGRARVEALKEMARRTKVEDIHQFVAAIVQADQLGVPMAHILRIQSEQMRIRRRQRAEEQAMKAPIKMLFPMVFLIFPAMFIVILGPALPSILNLFSGVSR